MRRERVFAAALFLAVVWAAGAVLMATNGEDPEPVKDYYGPESTVSPEADAQARAFLRSAGQTWGDDRTKLESEEFCEAANLIGHSDALTEFLLGASEGGYETTGGNLGRARAQLVGC